MLQIHNGYLDTADGLPGTGGENGRHAQHLLRITVAVPHRPRRDLP